MAMHNDTDDNDDDGGVPTDGPSLPSLLRFHESKELMTGVQQQQVGY